MIGTKTDLKSESFTVLGTSRFVHTVIKLMKNCVSFSNPSITLLSQPSVTRKYHAICT